FSSSLMTGQVDAVNYTIKKFEQAGFNVTACFGRDADILTRFLLDQNRKARVDILLSFSLKFNSSLNEKLKTAIQDLDIPIINGINLYSLTIDKWRTDPLGIPPMDVVWTMGVPEISGAIEPTPLIGKLELIDQNTGKTFFLHKPITENFDRLLPRLKNWVRLQRKNNAQKKVAILYYNHSQGKQNVGASYLNVFSSIKLILKRMKDEGYKVTSDKILSENGIRDMILKTGRNIGSWAPGELDRMLQEGKIIRIPVATYKKWFAELPQDFQNNVIKQWGRVDQSEIMIKDNRFILPAVMLGNLVLLAEPARGWSDDPMKLYHDPTLFPHHQYIAVYLWLQKVFQADAMVHLGTHATYEWLPGKQAGLSPSCPPEVMITDIPNIYPYIVDDVGEGIQAKRRGRGVIIDHLTPSLKKGGLYHEYSKLYELINNYNRAVAINAATAPVTLDKIEELAIQLGIDQDLNLELANIDSDALEKIEHYLLELKENLMPYGMHTFGLPPSGNALADTAACIAGSNENLDQKKIRQSLEKSGPLEIDRFIKALNGAFVPAGEGNDPVRNPLAIPTGKNFFGFSPAKVPSESAWELGKKAAEAIIFKSLQEKNRYPQKVAVILWATETIRNEGVNESTILYLLGLEPVWDKSGRIKGTKVIPGKKLNRPRIDVLINPSGLYRDLFPSKLIFLDQAVQKASALTDIENLVKKHNIEIKNRLLESGMNQKDADTLSRIRIFTEKPGSYGNGVAELTSASGFWESDEEIVKVFEKRSGFAFGMGKWGQDAQNAFKENLKAVDVAIHSRSS
ncbi:MAG: cobaltochelatase subunit CobN, partial [Desulfosarcina sp.]|nr:cobaltochelatase subunit CobN [Desulfobacterales bacterium]